MPSSRSLELLARDGGSRPYTFLLLFAPFAFANGFLARAQTRFRHDLDRGAVSFLRGDIRVADFRGRQAPEIPARRGRRVSTS